MFYVIKLNPKFFTNTYKTIIFIIIFNIKTLLVSNKRIVSEKYDFYHLITHVRKKSMIHKDLSKNLSTLRECKVVPI